MGCAVKKTRNNDLLVGYVVDYFDCYIFSISVVFIFVSRFLLCRNLEHGKHFRQSA